MPTAPRIDATPSLPPASEVVPVEAHEDADVPEASTASERPDLFACLEIGRRGRDHAGLQEAARQFGGDLRAELAAIEAGTHPLQRRRSASR
jgi:hypothetical protein